MHFSRKYLIIPYIIFLLCFVALPLLVLIYYAFTNGEGQPTFDNFIAFFTGSGTIGTLVYSLGVAISVTVLCLLLAYPSAFILARYHFPNKTALLLLFIMPMWINFTLRITALKEILTFLEGNLAFHPYLNTVVCMTYDFLPFMILPIYTSLEKIDKSLVEAALDLGANALTTFLKVLLPLSMPGILSAVTMVFLPAMANYVALDMVYNSTYIMGSLINSYFSAYDWNNGSMISLVLLLLIFIITFFTNQFSEENEQNRRTLL